jgi:signal transduction histidine kinase
VGAEDKYQEKMKESDSLVYQAAHDLRAPLMSVKGLLNLIRQDPEREKLDYYFSLLERSIDKMNQSINDMISNSKNGRIKVELEDVNLKKVIEDSLQSMRFMKEAELVHFDLFVEDQNLISDYKILFSIFSNIISNAIRYRDPQKSSFLKIHTALSPQHVEITFKDNGIGIDEETQEKIFNKFFLGNDHQGGTGLGLYMVKTCLEKIGGSIRVESEIGEGTTFVVQIPR